MRMAGYARPMNIKYIVLGVDAPNLLTEQDRSDENYVRAVDIVTHSVDDMPDLKTIQIITSCQPPWVICG